MGEGDPSSRLSGARVCWGRGRVECTPPPLTIFAEPSFDALYMFTTPFRTSSQTSRTQVHIARTASVLPTLMDKCRATDVAVSLRGPPESNTFLVKHPVVGTEMAREENFAS